MAKTSNPFLDKLKKNKVARDAKRALLEMIRKHDDPALSQVCEPIVDGDSLAFVRNMIDVLNATEHGVGLAAPQIGILKRFIIVAPRSDQARLMVNPVIVERSKEVNSDYEGCLSYPGVSNYIERHDTIKVRWLEWKMGETTFRDGAFEVKEKEFTGYTARIIQHEVEHLDGICRVGEAWKDPTKRRTRSKASVMARLAAMTVLAAGCPARWRSA